MPKGKVVEEQTLQDEDASVVDETEQTEELEDTNDTESEAEDGQDSEQEQSDATEEADAESEEADAEPEAKEDEEPVESAEQLRIRQLEEENARLKGEKPADKEPVTKPVGAIDAFLKTVAPQSKKTFSTSKDEGERFDAIYSMTDHMIGSVLAEHVSPVMNQLASLAITLHNELEIRDLRQESGTFKSMEKFVREELQQKDWPTRRKDGAVKAIYQKLLGIRSNGNAGVSDKPKSGISPKAAAALRDVSGGSTTKPAKSSNGFKLTPEQETDYQDMVEHGSSLSREQYHAKWKARVAKAKAANRTLPKTFRSFSSS